MIERSNTNLANDGNENYFENKEIKKTYENKIQVKNRPNQIVSKSNNKMYSDEINKKTVNDYKNEYENPSLDDNECGCGTCGVDSVD